MQSILPARLSALVLTTLLGAGALAACDSDDQPAIGDEEIAELEARADRAVAAGIPGISITVRAGDQTVRIARGVADLTTGAPLAVNAHFRVGSMAKSMVASVVLQLVDEGALSLTDTVDHWLPGVMRSNGHATIEQLLRLESGIADYAADPRHMAPYYAGDFGYAWSPESLVALSQEHDADFAPGTAWAYSNTNYALLAMVVERITGQKVADVVAERITGPLGLRETTMPTTAVLEAPFSRGYLVGQGDPIDVTDINPTHAYGAGNLVSTGVDMVTFYGALAAGTIVPPRLLTRMMSVDPALPDTHYGMGLWRNGPIIPCGSFIGHDGAVPGYDATAFSRVDGKRQYAVMVSSLTVDDHAGDAAAHEAWKQAAVGAACGLE